MGRHWCDRCHCSVPLTEWRPVAVDDRLFMKHVGPMRDHSTARYVEPDENGETECGFVERVVTERV